MNEQVVMRVRVVSCHGDTWGFAFQAAARWVASNPDEVLLWSKSSQSADQGHTVTLYFLMEVEDE